jgi:hypothetical protein
LKISVQLPASDRQIGSQLSELCTRGHVAQSSVLKEDVDGGEVEYVNRRDVLRAVAPFMRVAYSRSVKSSGCGFAEG